MLVSSRVSWSCVLVLLAVGAAATSSAAPTRVFRQSSAKDFEEGEGSGSQILPSGEIVPGFKLTRIGVEAGFVWSSTAARDGSTAYFGTGDPARIVAVPLRGGGKNEEARRVLELDAPWVTALATRADGSLLAGTTPGGRVWTIDPQKATSREFARLTVEHIWTLVVDDSSGTVYAGTGPGGAIVAIDKAGKARVHWDSGDQHVVSLLALGGGRLLAGTSDRAALYSVAPDGHATALQDFEADEVRALARAGDGTFIAVNDFEQNAGAAARPATPQETAAPKGTKIAVGGAAPISPGALPRPGQVKGKAAVYRLGDDGRIEQVFAISDGYITGLTAGAAGDVYVSAGVDGRVYHVLADRSTAVAVDVPEHQALTLLHAGDGFLVGTGDAAGLFRATPARGADALYTSRVLDSVYGARWGRLRWAGGAGARFETRAGNTARPDVTWSAWKPLADANRDGARAPGRFEGQVGSPDARYLQYRVVLDGPQGVREVETFYLPQNQRARVLDLTLADTAATSAGVARAHSSTLKLRWKVENPDADELIYRLSYRQESEPLWRPLGGPEPLSKAEYDWNTEYVPDGRYVVRVWASDERAVAQGRALDFTFTSSTLLVDNGRPEVTGLALKGGRITGHARDAASPVAQVDFSINGGEWRPAAPDDGILDELDEPFTVTLPPLGPGTHVVTVRALDSADNAASAKLLVPVK